MVCKYFLLLHGFPFHSADCFLCSEEVSSVLVPLVCVFVACTFAVISKKSLQRTMPWSFLPIFSSRNVMISAVAFKSLIHLELIFVSGVE